MTPLEQIDFIFFHIKDRIQYGGSYGYNNIWFHVQKSPEKGINTQTLLKEILKRLKEDGYITETILPNAQPVYHLSFLGLLFEGYYKAHESLNEERNWKKKIETQTLTNSSRLNRLTLILAVGTAVFAAYSILQIIDWFCQHF